MIRNTISINFNVSLITSFILLVLYLFVLIILSFAIKAYNVKDLASRLSIVAHQTAEEQNQTKSKFLAHMSHELRTPLNAIIGFSQLIKDNKNNRFSDESILQYGDYIYDAGTHLLDIIGDILDISKVEAGEMNIANNIFSVQYLLNSAIRLLVTQTHKNKITIIGTYNDNADFSLFADERLCKQIIYNILSNAIKFTEENGTIDINYHTNDDGEFLIKIKDNGIGIAEKDIKLVLEPFGQSSSGLNVSNEGTGLGLPLCVKLMEIQNGALTLKSKENVGTEVTLTFPREALKN